MFSWQDTYIYRVIQLHRIDGMIIRETEVLLLWELTLLIK